MSDEMMTARLMARFPDEAVKQRVGGGGKRLDYVEGHTVIHRLIDATGNRFDFRVLSLDQKGDLLTALVELTIPGLGSRQHIGVQRVAPGAGEDLTKGAITDALKKAATLFGVGLELYGPDYAGESATAAEQEDAAPVVAKVARKVADWSRQELWDYAADDRHDLIRRRAAFGHYLARFATKTEVLAECAKMKALDPPDVAVLRDAALATLLQPAGIAG